jgi:coenzyme F420-0:L-glutamate ligase/coenzyme F420-1:gamma-L-glutamate ligase
MELFAVDGIPEIRSGDDIATTIDARVDIRDDDVVCVASTIVSKAEGRARALDSFRPSPRARRVAHQLESVTGEQKDPRFAQAILEESEELLLETPFVLAVTNFGHVCPNAGIDRSNVPDADILLLPDSPTASAERIRSGLDADPAVIVTDTCGRPFRHGQRGVAIGHAGMPASRDWRGETDRAGHELEVTVEAVVDELAAAANLLSGEGDDGIPVVVAREFRFGDHGGSDDLFRAPADDLVRQALTEWSFDQRPE